MPETQSLVHWERAEVERSGHEAAATAVEELRVAAGDISRYLNPPADTCFPLEYAYHLLGDVRGKVILDLGCGKGENTLLLADRGAHVLSMDISESLIALARQRLEINRVSGDVAFLTGSAHNIPLRDESVDVVFGIAILHHLHLARAAAEVHRVLRQGGRAIFQEPIQNSKLIRGIRKLIPYRRRDISPFERPLSDQKLADFTGDFANTRERAFHLPHVRLAQQLPVPREYVRKLIRLDARMLNRFSSLNYYATIKVMEMAK